MKKVNAYALSTVMAAVAVADSGFACENCPDAEPPAAASVSPVNGGVSLKYSSLLFGYFIEHFDTVVYGKKSLPVLDAVMTQSDDGKSCVLMVVNKSPDEAVSLDLSALCPRGLGSVSATILSGDSPDAYNDIGSENRVVPQKTWLAVTDGKIALPPHSVAAIDF